MNITKQWVSSIVMLCQVFKTAVFSCSCLEIGKRFMIGLTLGDSFDIFAFKNSHVAFKICSGSFFFLYFFSLKHHPINVAAPGSVWAHRESPCSSDLISKTTSTGSRKLYQGVGCIWIMSPSDSLLSSQPLPNENATPGINSQPTQLMKK